MRRVASVHFPNWSIDRIVRRRHRPGRNRQLVSVACEQPGATGSPLTSATETIEPVLLVREMHGKEIVAAACPVAVAAGVRCDMTVAHARALLPGSPVHCHRHDPEGDAAALEALARWALRIAPRVAPDPPDGLLLDISGCERLYRSESRFMNMVANSLEWLGFTVRAACAATNACAWGMARFADDDRLSVPTGAEREALGPLPVEALRPLPAVCDALHEVGIDCIGHLLAMPRRELAARFVRVRRSTGTARTGSSTQVGTERGDDLLDRLEKALGERAEWIDSVRAPDIPQAEQAFAGPVRNPEAIALAVNQLLAELAGRLETRELGVRRLHVQFDLSDAAPHDEVLVLGRPSREVRHLRTLVAPRLERLPLDARGLVGVERIVIVAAQCGRCQQGTGAFWADGSSDGHAGSDRAPGEDRAGGELIDLLAERLGDERVVRVTARATHVPERTFHTQPVRSAPARPGVDAVRAVDRPSCLLHAPEPIRVTRDPDGVPRVLHWRGDQHDIVMSRGPERIGEPWWRVAAGRSDDPAVAALAARDYFKVQSAGGRWLWIYRAVHEPDQEGTWYVHGEWV